MKKRTVLILLAALVLSLSACEKQPEPAMDTQAPPVLAAPAEASAPEIPAEPESEPEKEWTQADIRRMLFWDGEASTLVRFFDETGYSYCAGPVAKAADEPGFTYLGDGTVTFRLQADDGTVYDYTLTLSAGDAGANWTASDSVTAP